MTVRSWADHFSRVNDHLLCKEPTHAGLSPGDGLWGLMLAYDLGTVIGEWGLMLAYDLGTVIGEWGLMLAYHLGTVFGEWGLMLAYHLGTVFGDL